MDNDKTDGEGKVCTGQTSGAGNTSADRTHVANPAATVPATTETSKLAAPAVDAATVAAKPTTSAVAAPTASKKMYIR